MNRSTPSALPVAPVSSRPGDGAADSVSQRIAEAFAPEVRERGEALLREGRVTAVEAHGDTITANVRGRMTYRVELLRDDDVLVVSCTCPYFEEGQVCKHIWATVRLAEQEEHVLPPPAGRPFRLLMAELERLDEGDGLDDVAGGTPVSSNGSTSGSAALPAVSTAGWRRWFARLGQQARLAATDVAEQEILYFINLARTLAHGMLVVDVFSRTRKLDGEWGRLRASGLTVGQIATLPDERDRQALALLSGIREHVDWEQAMDAAPVPSSVRIPTTALTVVMPLLCATGRCWLQTADEADAPAQVVQRPPLQWEPEGWRMQLEVRQVETPPHYVLVGGLRRGEAWLPLSAPRLLLAGGLVFSEVSVAPLQDEGVFYWIGLLRKSDAVRIPLEDGPDLVEKLLRLPTLPPVTLPEDLRFETCQGQPLPVLRLRAGEGRPGEGWLGATLGFEYEGHWLEATSVQPGIFDAPRRRFIRRDLVRERAAAEQLRALGLRPDRSQAGTPEYRVPVKRLPALVRDLVLQGWRIESEGRLFRPLQSFALEVRSGVDWFELHGNCDFGTATAHLPELLRALRQGETVVTLSDGSLGVLSEEWFERYGFLATLGEVEDGHLRFSSAQISLLDTLLAAQPEVRVDTRFQALREQLHRFSGVEPALEPPGFVGELRPYQREGLGWLLFLQRFGFGGCLADAMGLGKTAQTLALLETRRVRRQTESLPPSLVVAPRSLVFNWRQEAEKFTPRMRVLEHTGVGRARSIEQFADYDLILTTYGTLRRDILLLKDFAFDYAILDEAQAIKNARSESAKAARLLNCRHRLALSGTPVENHLGELWSLFEFLNPGMLGAASVFQLTASGGRTVDAELQPLLARALRPFILRRTKEQVARDLPPKTEQTIYCEMEPEQRQAYNELRDHYRRTLLGLVDTKGLQRTRIQILEALLRLRQAACHPGLLDPARVEGPSAKLDTFFMHLAEVLESGSKVLVFSQFTSLLALIRKRLDADGITYEYLDGRTRNRQERVERFQQDPNCQLFLISLRAGGQGLNLTAAEYVFLLDPWWNPAVEAQAIDRAHRIGQVRPVFAYRLIVRDTVEEKVLELQATKRELADAIITADNSLLRQLERADLELLLS
ncbi:DEAD/DEAH box helicase [Chloracidobacterium aggregatum]|uniref:DEAD/DEAH box helicase n=2 Tax=Chloracidobacterium TaxID=458032 RepID=A0ABX8B503_9BACT|nr:DEAD/DEAH box helicase [Chloracidobacterium aggregatum]QUV95523.1 DEAD/DEAH box helicase [Chloracidobacterium sp. N]